MVGAAPAGNSQGEPPEKYGTSFCFVLNWVRIRLLSIANYDVFAFALGLKVALKCQEIKCLIYSVVIYSFENNF